MIVFFNSARRKKTVGEEGWEGGEWRGVGEGVCRAIDANGITV